MRSTSKMMDYYEILRVDRCASIEEIRKAYQQLIKQCHPDKCSSDCDGSALIPDFVTVHKAWQVLCDEASRHEYDESLQDDERQRHAIDEEISLQDMSLGPDGSYFRICRCGGEYLLTEDDGQEDCLIACNTCSLIILVKSHSPR